MDTITLIKLIVGLAMCALPIGYWFHMIVQLNRDGKELERMEREDFPSLAADSAASD